MHSIERQPRLITPMLHLRPLQSGEWEALYSVASDPAIWELHPANDRWRRPVFRNFFEQVLDSGGALVAIDPAHAQVIGSSRFDITRAAAGAWEIGGVLTERSVESAGGRAGRSVVYAIDRGGFRSGPLMAGVAGAGQPAR